jgi:hypothetical protein
MEILAKHFHRVALPVCGLVLSSLALASMASGQAVDEYEIKAAFLYNFTKFVEWPSSPSSDTFNICILGDNPFGSFLDQLVKGKTAYSRAVQIRKLKDPVEARQCQIVFVRREEETKAIKVIEAVRGMPVLTVSDRRRFSRLTGGIVSLLMGEGHVSVGINFQAAQSAGLKISAKLMSLAKSVKDEGEEQ